MINLAMSAISRHKLDKTDQYNFIVHYQLDNFFSLMADEIKQKPIKSSCFGMHDDREIPKIFEVLDSRRFSWCHSNKNYLRGDFKVF